jgi:hypothetical protein
VKPVRHSSKCQLNGQLQHLVFHFSVLFQFDDGPHFHFCVLQHGKYHLCFQELDQQLQGVFGELFFSLDLRIVKHRIF